MLKRRIYKEHIRFLTKELDINPETYNPIEFVTRIANSVSTSKKTERSSHQNIRHCYKK